MISANEVNSILRQYLSTSDGQALLKNNGINVSFYDEAKLLQIAEEIKDKIINTFLSITNHASLIDAQDYFGSSYVKIGKVRHLKAADRVSISFSSHALYRPSLWAGSSEKYPTAGYTGSGVKDIFALITNGTSKSGNVYGYWSYYDAGEKQYVGNEGWTRAWLPRIGKPFIQKIINKYESLYPGIEIDCPPEWQ